MAIASISSQIQSVEDALRHCRRSFSAVFLFSVFTNLLTLTPMFYMINVFDKAVGTSSFPTLVSLVVVAVFLSGIRLRSWRLLAILNTVLLWGVEVALARGLCSDFRRQI